MLKKEDNLSQLLHQYQSALKVKTPIISIIIIGEGGSGGAIALATADKILMLENSSLLCNFT